MNKNKQHRCNKCGRYMGAKHDADEGVYICWNCNRIVIDETTEECESRMLAQMEKGITESEMMFEEDWYLEVE